MRNSFAGGCKNGITSKFILRDEICDVTFLVVDGEFSVSGPVVEMIPLTLERIVNGRLNVMNVCYFVEYTISKFVIMQLFKVCHIFVVGCQ